MWVPSVAEVSGVPAMFATDGTHIYKLFSDTTSDIAFTIKTALWPMKKPTRTKQALKGGVEITTAVTTTALTLSVDTERAQLPQTLSGTNTGQWYNTAQTLGSWINNALT